VVFATRDRSQVLGRRSARDAQLSLHLPKMVRHVASDRDSPIGYGSTTCCSMSDRLFGRQVGRLFGRQVDRLFDRQVDRQALWQAGEQSAATQ